ncbi:MAG: NADH-quinone oxidoreductase subunit N [Bacteroidia bacterium]|nr:NADH-quinone oxidoreductase subunit N [Bacteroidia bacterium]MDW8158484.1 NADH-quinone oxidoreductase subunit N [Bacteroidia bacterium]
MSALEWFALFHNIKRELPFLFPHLILCLGIALNIIVGAFYKNSAIFYYGALASAFGSLTSYLLLLPTLGNGAFSIFFNSLVIGGYTAIGGILLNIGLVTTLLFIQKSNFYPRNQELYLLLLGAFLGLHLLICANQWILVFVGTELSAISSYCLVAYPKGKKTAAEAAVKYVIYGSVAAGVFIYGISLLFAFTGNLYLVNQKQTWLVSSLPSMALIGAYSFILAGLSFKIGAFPFHFWIADVYTGAFSATAAYLATSVKIAALIFIMRLVASLPDALQSSVQNILAILAIITLLVGNIGALGQKNYKKLLAYSSIGQSGFLLLGTLAPSLAGVLLFYLGIYLFMQNGAFYACTLLAEKIGSEYFRDWEGKALQFPILSIALIILFAGLIGLPPTAGFSAKFNLFTQVYILHQQNSSSYFLVALAIGILATLISLYYYLKVPAIMLFNCMAFGKKATPEIPQSPSISTEILSFSILITLLLGIYGFDKLIFIFQQNFEIGY